jgi:hypothetical protein
VAGRKRVVPRHVDERVGVPIRHRRPVTLDHLLEPARDKVGGSYSECDQHEEDGSAPEEGCERREHQPHEPGGAKPRESDEERVQPADALLHHPPLDVAVEGDQVGSSCFVDSISCSGSNGFPRKLRAPREVACSRA